MRHDLQTEEHHSGMQQLPPSVASICFPYSTNWQRPSTEVKIFFALIFKVHKLFLLKAGKRKQRKL